MKKIIFLFQTITLALDKVLKVIDKHVESFSHFLEKVFSVSSKIFVLLIKMILVLAGIGIFFWIISTIPQLFWIIFSAVLFALVAFYLLINKNR
jgi:hypothetical protein